MLLKPLNWSDPAPPTDGICYYNHIHADTPFGRFLLTWKGWKEAPKYGFDETPWGDCEYPEFDSIKDAKNWAEAELARRIANAIIRNPVELCTRVLSYAATSSEIAKDRKPSEIKAALGIIFDMNTIGEAVNVMTGEKRPKNDVDFEVKQLKAMGQYTVSPNPIEQSEERDALLVEMQAILKDSI